MYEYKRRRARGGDAGRAKVGRMCNAGMVEVAR